MGHTMTNERADSEISEEQRSNECINMDEDKDVDDDSYVLNLNIGIAGMAVERLWIRLLDCFQTHYVWNSGVKQVCSTKTPSINM
jgi:hypothetical protein